MNCISKTDTGLVRANNQDSCLTGELSDNSVFAVVCDGMGGAAGGAVASSLAVRLIEEQLTSHYNPSMGDKAIKNLLDTVINAAGIGIFDAACEDDSLAGMGTTAVVALIRNETAYIAHAGDSRAYLISGDTINRLTRDHSVVQQMVDNGKITQEEALEHPQRNIITRALGVDEYVDTDYCEQHVSPGDCLLLCSDGLTNCVSDADILATASVCGFPLLAQTLISQAKDKGAPDNVTVVTVF